MERRNRMELEIQPFEVAKRNANDVAFQG
jgi:hypothetical protein